MEYDYRITDVVLRIRTMVDDCYPGRGNILDTLGCFGNKEVIMNDLYWFGEHCPWCDNKDNDASPADCNCSRDCRVSWCAALFV